MDWLGAWGEALARPACGLHLASCPVGIAPWPRVHPRQERRQASRGPGRDRRVAWVMPMAAGRACAAPSCRPWSRGSGRTSWLAFTSWFSSALSAWRISGRPGSRQKIGACASSSRAWPRALDCPEKAACPCQRPGLLPPLATMPNTGKLQRVHVLVLLGKVHVRGSFDMPRKSLVRPCAGLARVFPYPDSASVCAWLSGPAMGLFGALPGLADSLNHFDARPPVLAF